METIIFSDRCADIQNIENISTYPLLNLKNQIQTLPMYCTIGKEEFECGSTVDLDMRTFFQKVEISKSAKTSSVNQAITKKLFKAELDKGNNIICFSMSKVLSGTYNNILLAQEELKAEYPNSKIEVIDSLSVALGEGMMALDALKMVQEGRSYNEIASYFETYKNYYNTEFYANDIKFLIESGRITGDLKAFLGQVLNIKPLLYTADDGKVCIGQKTMGEKKKIKALIERMEARIDRKNINSIGIIHSNNIESAIQLRNEIDKLKITKNYIISELGPVIASHIGSGGYGLVYKMKDANRHYQ